MATEPPALCGRRRHGNWYKVPLLWLSLLLFLASLAGCILTIVLSARNVDPATATAGGEILRMQLERPDKRESGAY